MAMHIDAVARVYARSLFEEAQNAGGAEKLAEVAGELETICEIGRGDRRFREFLASPIIGTEDRGRSLRQIFANRVTDLTLRFLLLLNRKHRLGHLESINAALDQLVQSSLGRIEVDVITAAPLGDQQRQFIAERIRAALGQEPVLHASTDPTMIGGIRLRVGDRLIDGSIATRLGRLRTGLLTGGDAAVRARAARIIEDREH